MKGSKNVKFGAAVLLLLAAAALSCAPAAYGRSAAASAEEFERRLAAIMKQSNGRRGRALTYNGTLARVARERAQDMGSRNYFSHVNPDGIGPNYLVTRAGYDLPDFYGRQRSSNNIESIAAGNDTPEEAWENWMESSGHRNHLLGVGKFYAEQTEYGVGYAYVSGSRYGHYWVILVARPGSGGSSEVSESDEDEDGDAAEEAEARDGEEPEAVVEEEDDAEPEAVSSCNLPNVVRGANGRLRPASGYMWVDEDDPSDLRVKLMPGLIKTGNGYSPARGYTWVNPRDPKDLRVRPIR